MRLIAIPKVIAAFIFFLRRQRVWLVGAALLAGCHRNEVGSYRVPKEAEPAVPAAPEPAAPPASVANNVPLPAPATAPGGMAGASVATASGAGLAWTAPSDWQAKPLGAMRKGSFSISGDAGAVADLSITAFPGAVGGELANVNRWRGQVGLPAIDESALASSVTRLTSNGLTITLVDLAGTDPANAQRILGAMVPYEGAMWFFKLSGPDALVAKNKPAFVEFIKTVKVAAPVAP
jgi:hypothetical protein